MRKIHASVIFVSYPQNHLYKNSLSEQLSPRLKNKKTAPGNEPGAA